MRQIRKILSAFLVLSLLYGIFAVNVSAADYTDVPTGTWYEQAVKWCRDNGIMGSTSDTALTFEPNTAMSRSMLAAILYRTEGSPVVNYLMTFPDVEEGAWYTEAIRWAASERVITGYDNDLFGVNDPVTREQIAAILWRYAGSPTTESGADFADEADISAYAVQAVGWVQANGIMNGVEGNRFDPKGNATRAQAAVILFNYLNGETPQESTAPETPEATGKTLVAYYSATGSTEAVAKTIADYLGADTFVITPVESYTSSDLNWTDDDSRVVREHNDLEGRHVELTTTAVPNFDSYDTVFIGYPIWWGGAAWVVDDFVTDNDFTGKTVIPFCTSSSSPLGNSGSDLAALAGTGNWLEGQRFQSSVSEETVRAWLEGLGL